ncbi:FtsX-like permease family protein [Nocardioides sp.]|uniref:FtsX-like permease family protein n=1 Tax=Nocardioides sp. TaxID=35761 RepID=UPI0039E2D97A
MWAAIRHRKGQAAVMAALAALITACAAFAPLYDRAMQQSLSDVRLASATPLQRGVQLTNAALVTKSPDQHPPMSPDEMVDTIPATVRDAMAAPITGYSARAATEPFGNAVLIGILLGRTGQCDHIEVAEGSCPTRSGEIMVSEADVTALGLEPGDQLELHGEPSWDDSEEFATATLTVVGVYRTTTDPWWFGTALTGSAGLGGEPGQLLHDSWLTDPGTFTQAGLLLSEEVSWVGLHLGQERMGVDRTIALGTAVAGFRREASDQAVNVISGLPAISDDLVEQHEQSKVTVPLLMVQLAFLALVVLWLVLRSATEQRRPEIALARLRGRGRRGARARLLGELLPVVLGGAVPGVLLALAAGWWVRHLMLPGSAPFEVSGTLVLAIGAAVAALAVAVFVAAQLSAREPIDALLRRSATQRRGWRIGIADALVVAAAGGVVLTFVSGGLSGPAALAGPALLALAVGLVLAHLSMPTAAVVGRALVRRGRLVGGLSLLDAARSQATRSTVVIVTVTAALVTFAADAFAVGDRNRALAAAQQAGAPLVAEVAGVNLRGVEAAVAAADPSGREMTVVARSRPVGQDAMQTLAVDPEVFPRLALGDAGDPGLWQQLVPSDAQPLEITGTDLRVDITNQGFKAIGASSSKLVDMHLGVDVIRNGELLTTRIGDVPGIGGTRHGSGTLSCEAGCFLVGIHFDTLPGAQQAGTIRLSDMTVDGAPVALGPADQWGALKPDEGSVAVASDDGTSLALTVDVSGTKDYSLPQVWLAVDLPALVTGSLPPGASDEQLPVTGLDGITRIASLAGRLDRVPASPPRTAVVALSTLERGSRVGATVTLSVWLERDDPALLDRLDRALAEQGVQVQTTTSLTEVRRRYDESTAAWSLDLAAVVGLVALLVALLALLVMAATTWRQRTRDLAALWLAGVPRRQARWITVLASLPAVVVAAIAGTACGALGASLSMPDVPLFATSPLVDTLDLDTPWRTLLVTAVVAAIVLVATVAMVGASAARRARLTNLKEVS